MLADSISTLLASGWSAEVINTLITLRYDLTHHDAVTEEAEFHLISPSAGIPSHGFILHRNDGPLELTRRIFDAGHLHHQRQTREAFQSLLTAAGLQLRS